MNNERDIFRDTLYVNSGCSIRYRHTVCQVVRMCTLIPYIAFEEQCSTEGELRLADGGAANEGRVEICLGGVWGTICDNNWGADDAVVACRQLGLPTGCMDKQIASAWIFMSFFGGIQMPMRYIPTEVALIQYIMLDFSVPGRRLT